MRCISVTGAIMVAGIACSAAALERGESTRHPFAFLAPALGLDAFTPSTLAEDQVFVKVLPGRGNELAVIAATRTTAAPARLIAWMRRVDLVQRGRYVSNVGRFSNPPQLEDLAAVTLEDQDFEDIRHCRPRDCGVKLSGAEMAYANHYKDGAVAVTAIAGSPGDQYLVYAHRSDVDVLGGVWGGLVRRMIERRVKNEAPGIVNALRVRLESGDPP